MNYNQKILERSLREEMVKANITYNKYREILDVCLAALEEPAQASEPKQTGLTGKFKNLVQVKKNAKQEAVNVPLEATIQPEPFKYIRAEGATFIKEADEKDAYAERLNEIADKVNAIYAAVNKLKEPVIKKDTRKTLDDYPLTKRQLDQIADHFKSKGIGLEELSRRIKNELANDLKEQRIKGGFK